MPGEIRKLLLPDGGTLEYTVDRGRRKNIYIAVKNGRVVLKLPFGADEKRGEQFLIRKADWVMKSMKVTQTEAVRPVSFSEGERFTLAGKEYVICCEQAERYRPPSFEDGRLVIAVCGSYDEKYVTSQAQKAVYSEALRIIGSEAERLCALTGLRPAKLTVKRMTASWGRCSSGGNISINLNVIYFPLDCIDYVIIHELCHLRHMDHSKDFWGLVSKWCPDWKSIRARMG
ncbi:MAG: M48 family metallopeptidase [Ruminococcus sp.]|nr:M48 family metallopeptidase [Ruminococcus sp.]